MSSYMIVIDFGEDAEEFNDVSLKGSLETAWNYCMKECKKLVQELDFSGFRSNLKIGDRQFTVVNEDDNSQINYFIQPIFSKKNKPVLFGEEQAK
jgi:hypothetical protein